MEWKVKNREKYLILDGFQNVLALGWQYLCESSFFGQYLCESSDLVIKR